ncbi:MAG: hypothetical protein NC123_12625 [Butyrivibrio sp.]|nr:hypothetical protein [Acetatifactor muris]MCM1560366.1 hypothetical protein [Butyrivibrio sp.]
MLKANYRLTWTAGGSEELFHRGAVKKAQEILPGKAMKRMRIIFHAGQYDPNSNREEEKIAMRIFQQSRDKGAFSLLGKIEDYQTPLKSNADDEAGKIVLLSCDDKIMRILELKKPDSKETMLRCALEGYTYLKTVNSDKLITDFGYNPEKNLIKASPLVFYGGEQHKEMSQSRPQLRKLMALLDSKPYYIKEDQAYIIVEE